MKRLVVDWQGLYLREGGVRLWCTRHVCGRSQSMVRDPLMRCHVTCDLVEINSASSHRCTIMILPCLPSETRVQPLKHVAGRPCYTTQGKGMHPLGCHIKQSVLPQLRQLLPGGSVALWSDVVYVCTSKSRGE